MCFDVCTILFAIIISHFSNVSPLGFTKQKRQETDGRCDGGATGRHEFTCMVCYGIMYCWFIAH